MKKTRRYSLDDSPAFLAIQAGAALREKRGIHPPNHAPATPRKSAAFGPAKGNMPRANPENEYFQEKHVIHPRQFTSKRLEKSLKNAILMGYMIFLIKRFCELRRLGFRKKASLIALRMRLRRLNRRTIATIR
jgi:hypothetical protein